MLRNPTRVPEEILSNTTLLQGKTVVITGGSYGIGYETTRALSKMGVARIIIGNRNKESTEKAIATIQQEPNTQNTVFEFLQLDLGSIASSKQFADEILRRDLVIDYLIFNAGVGNSYTTDDGLESTFQVNHLGHFIIVYKLLDSLAKHGTRVISVSSGLHKVTKTVELEKVKTDPAYFGLTGYNHSKLLNVLHMKGLQQEFDRIGSKAVAVSLNPGMVSTEFSSTAPWVIAKTWKYLVLPLFGLYVPDGAMTTLHCVVADELVPGGYYDSCRIAEESQQAKDKTNIEKLWKVSKEYASL